MRFMGLLDRLSSPARVLLKLRDASMPDKRRIEVPELPQSSTLSGALKLFGAFKIRVRSSVKSTSQPRAFMISRVARQSAPKEKFEIFTLAPVWAAKIKLR